MNQRFSFEDPEGTGEFPVYMVHARIPNAAVGLSNRVICAITSIARNFQEVEISIVNPCHPDPDFQADGRNKHDLIRLTTLQTEQLDISAAGTGCRKVCRLIKETIERG